MKSGTAFTMPSTFSTVSTRSSVPTRRDHVDQQVQRRTVSPPRSACSTRDLGAHLAGHHRLVRATRADAGQEQQVAGQAEGHVVADRLRRRRQGQAKRGRRSSALMRRLLPQPIRRHQISRRIDAAELSAPFTASTSAIDDSWRTTARSARSATSAPAQSENFVPSSSVVIGCPPGRGVRSRPAARRSAGRRAW